MCSYEISSMVGPKKQNQCTQNKLVCIVYCEHNYTLLRNKLLPMSTFLGGIGSNGFHIKWLFGI